MLGTGPDRCSPSLTPRHLPGTQPDPNTTIQHWSTQRDSWTSTDLCLFSPRGHPDQPRHLRTQLQPPCTPPQGHFLSLSLSHTPCVPTQLALYTHPRTHPHTPGHQHLSDRQCILEHCHSFLAWEGEMVLAAPGSRRELCLSRSSLRAVAPLPRPPQVSPKGSPCTHARVPSTVSPPVPFCSGN